MLLTLMFLTLASAQPSMSGTTDTTVAVQRGARLELQNFTGDVNVRAWNRNAVRVVARHSIRDWIEVQSTGSLVSVESGSRRGVARSVDYDLNVPVWMAVDVSGMGSDITLEGLRNDVKAETVKGNISLAGGSGNIQLSSVQGKVVVSGSRGRMDLSSVNDEVRATGVSGEISAESVNGGIVLDRVESSNIDASTVNGAISYDGTIRDGGRYSFSSHNGDLSVAVPSGANAAVSVETYQGDFSSSFPYQVGNPRRARSKRFNFTVGSSGSAQLELQTFGGSIQLRRPGERRSTEAEHEE